MDETRKQRAMQKSGKIEKKTSVRKMFEFLICCNSSLCSHIHRASCIQSIHNIVSVGRMVVPRVLYCASIVFKTSHNTSKQMVSYKRIISIHLACCKRGGCFPLVVERNNCSRVSEAKAIDPSLELYLQFGIKS